MKSRKPYETPPKRLDSDSAQNAGSRSNFLRLAVYQIALRVGWIFKTESVIMPAFLDIIGGSGWLRGCLPMLNRFGQSIPPLLLSQRIGNLQKKKFALAGTTFCMGASFLALSAIWHFTKGEFYAMPFVFLAIYAFFFVSTGVTQLLTNTLIGKLVASNVRGGLQRPEVLLEERSPYFARGTCCEIGSAPKLDNSNSCLGLQESHS